MLHSLHHAQLHLVTPTDESPDEAASTRYFLERRRNPDAIPPLARLDWLGATEYTPMDEYTGPGAA